MEPSYPDYLSLPFGADLRLWQLIGLPRDLAGRLTPGRVHGPAWPDVSQDRSFEVMVDDLTHTDGQLVEALPLPQDVARTIRHDQPGTDPLLILPVAVCSIGSPGDEAYFVADLQCIRTAARTLTIEARFNTLAWALSLELRPVLFRHVDDGDLAELPNFGRHEH